MAEPGMMEMLKQARGLQKRMNKVQKKAEKREVTAESADGLVSVVCTGKPLIKRILIDPALLGESDKRVVQDALTSTVNAALKKAQAMVDTEMQKVAGDLGLPGSEEEAEAAIADADAPEAKEGGRLRRLLRR